MVGRAFGGYSLVEGVPTPDPDATTRPLLAAGERLVFGRAVMLCNVASSGWLRVLPTCARLERDCLALRLVRAPSPECALVLAPQVM